MNNGVLFIISAPSGCGKTSLVKALIKKVENLCVSISHTTRQPRSGEIQGKNYFFVSKDEFNKMKSSNNFIESTQVFDNNYGSSKQSVQDLLNSGFDVILEIDWRGFRQIKQTFSHSVGIFILPPSKVALEERLTNRGQDNKGIINRRMHDAVSEMQHFNEFNYLVINDNFDVALNNLSTIVHAERLTLAQQSNKYQNLLKTLI
ncbi:guanylate kinase [Candidatus Vesicomyidisocius calyptogenae]|uniref:Guanylate kinase n=1 Tax=Vesicomyosocius okutanii subsp. Calyptogena okutanii (strain HA) TaxID=412965 RepID=A5CWP3_VESOH|nr:guanylate kinase [Candidatus Vesicomyosocius okutanii]BAF61632.1 guanylate kinase [Candidatus Vesicomyosocius okutanii]